MPVTSATRLRLAFRSGDVCALPDCGKRLTIDNQSAGPTTIGEAAHIAGERERSARHAPEMTDSERNCYDNLIYLCRNCHKIIDALPQGPTDYPTDRLKRIKTQHETRVRSAMLDAFADVGFPELAEAIQWIVKTGPQTRENDFSLVAPGEKLSRNELGGNSEMIVTMGLSLSHEVRNFVASETQADHRFPDRLKSGFLQEYHRLRKRDHLGDELFDLMCRYAQRGLNTQVEKSAGLAVLVYLFETCEVFEK